MRRPCLQNPRRARAAERRRLAILTLAFLASLGAAMTIEAGWTVRNARLIAAGL